MVGLGWWGVVKGKGEFGGECRLTPIFVACLDIYILHAHFLSAQARISNVSLWPSSF